jgi:hypothetical protein
VQPFAAEEDRGSAMQLRWGSRSGNREVVSGVVEEIPISRETLCEPVSVVRRIVTTEKQKPHTF